MGFQLLDIILIVIMLVSGVLALMRGFTREVLSLLAWGLAAIAAYFAVTNDGLIQWTIVNVPYANQPTLAKVAAGGAIFLLVLLIVSIISVKISDLVVDSSVGAFDRTLGFLYGLARGLVLVAIAFLYYGWFVPVDKQDIWVKEARTLPIMKSVGEKILELTPPDIREMLTNTALAEGQKTQGTATEPAYPNTETQGMDNLVNGTGTGTAGEPPQFGQSEESTGQ
jgi:membrane protein required for colicin V production